jgi:hypothetical protein
VFGRKSYTQEELDNSKAAIKLQLGAYETFVEALAKATKATPDKAVASAREAFEPRFFNNLTLVLDRHFIHRLRIVTGKDSNPLNEVEMLSDSLMNNNGVLRGNNVIKWVPDDTVVKLAIGDSIWLTAEEFGRLSTAFHAEIERKFV